MSYGDSAPPRPAAMLKSVGAKLFVVDQQGRICALGPRPGVPTTGVAPVKTAAAS
ncbi:hypothetical protein [Streptomyces aureus]|uniref:hypothetical protein n=1 Tax=Streptomyces aureus TaxID=193461 RepID=UPI0031E01A47